MSGLDIRNVSFSYGRGDGAKRILNSVSFNIPEGKLSILLGANGAGKSTMLKCINGLIKPGNGSILWKENDILRWSAAQRAELFGYVPQSISAASGLTVMETVLSGRLPHFHGKASSEDLDLVSQTLEDFGLADYAFRSIRALSGGERQRVLFARALVQNPEILLLDEPTSNLDLHYQVETMDILKQLSREKKITTAAIIHDLNAALAYADRIVVLDHGCVLAEGTPEEALTSEVIKTAYRVNAEIAEVHGHRIVLVTGCE